MTMRQINLIRAVSPYINPSIRPHILAFISFCEFQENINKINTPISSFISSNEPILIESDNVFEAIKNYAKPEEKSIIENIQMIKQFMSLMSVMNDGNDKNNMFGNLNEILNTTTFNTQNNSSGSSEATNNVQSNSSFDMSKLFEVMSILNESSTPAENTKSSVSASTPSEDSKLFQREPDRINYNSTTMNNTNINKNLALKNLYNSNINKNESYDNNLKLIKSFKND